MNFFSKLVVALLIVLALFYVKDNFFNSENDVTISGEKNNLSQNLPDIKGTTPQEPEIEEPKAAKPTVAIYFTSETNSGLKQVSRELPENKNKMEFAVEELLKGPDFKEKTQGYSSEIPKGTKLLSIKEDKNQIIINLSDEFQYGGGTESQYSRLNQLIKTVLAQKTSKPVYLYLNGEKAEAIGGEGIIITQPLSGNSLNG